MTIRTMQGMWKIFMLCLSLGAMGQSLLWADQEVRTAPQQIVVALDGSGQYRSIQEAVDAAKQGDIIFIKPGVYAEDVTIHSKEKIHLIGAGMEQVILLGRERVGVFHVGKWPYGATDVEISGLTINEHGGHAMGIFNGRGIFLRPEDE